MDLVSLLNDFQKIALVFVFWKVRISLGRLFGGLHCISVEPVRSVVLFKMANPASSHFGNCENIKLEQNLYVQFM